jgi:hypothetical protein
MANKFITVSHKLGAALASASPTKDPALWKGLQALRSLVESLETNAARVEARLTRLEAGAKSKNGHNIQK